MKFLINTLLLLLLLLISEVLGQDNETSDAEDDTVNNNNATVTDVDADIGINATLTDTGEELDSNVTDTSVTEVVIDDTTNDTAVDTGTTDTDTVVTDVSNTTASSAGDIDTPVTTPSDTDIIDTDTIDTDTIDTDTDIIDTDTDIIDTDTVDTDITDETDTGVIDTTEDTPSADETVINENKVEGAGTIRSCSFGLEESSINTCNLKEDAQSLGFRTWKFGRADDSFWVGGPGTDADNDVTGAFAYACMSGLSAQDLNQSAWLIETPNKKTGTRGNCLSFQYAIDGLNAETLSIILITYSSELNVSQQENNHASENLEAKSLAFLRPKEPNSINYMRELLIISDSTSGKWIRGHVSFSSEFPHSVAFVASADSKYSWYRGYIALDNLNVYEGNCRNECNFESDLCDWKNGENDNFDWQFGRSTLKRGSGPPRDQTSSLYKYIKTGGYAFIDSSYPRRPGDTAKLISTNKFFRIKNETEFSNGTSLEKDQKPICMKFWVHMFGGGIGSLSINSISDKNVTLWKKSGPSGLNLWYPAQVTLSIPNSRIEFEAEIKKIGSGDIAVDSILFDKGPCPQFPPSSTQGPSIADCTFLVNACSWKMVQPISRINSAIPMVKLESGIYPYSPKGKTKIPFTGTDKYVSFDLGFYEHRLRNRAYLVSPELDSTDTEPLCLSFWVFMYTAIPTETKIGALKLILSTSESNTTIWSIQNEQHSKWEFSQVPIHTERKFRIFIEGTKGTKKEGKIAIDEIALFRTDCSILPLKATPSMYDCSFDSGLCSWTVDEQQESNDAVSSLVWTYADFNTTINVLHDHTYGEEKSGFLFLETFKNNISSTFSLEPQQESPQQESQEICLTFYFVLYYADESAILSISSQSDEDISILWKIDKSNIPTMTKYGSEPEWTYGQVQINTRKKIIFEGSVKNGGWAIDDIRAISGIPCRKRPI